MLEPSPDFFRNIIERMPEGIWVADRQHRMIYVNQAMQGIAGVGAHKMLGMSVLDDFPPAILEHFRPFYLAASQSLSPLRWDCPINTPGNEPCWQGGWLIPKVEAGCFAGMICTVSDLTELKQAEEALSESEALLRTVIDEIPEPVIVKDAEGNFLLANETVARLYNTTTEEIRGKHDDDFGVPHAMADAFRQNVLDIMARGETEVVFEDSRDSVTGEIQHYRSIKRPFKDAAGNNRCLILATNITDIIRQQEKVAESERRLQDVLRVTREGIWDWHIPTGQVIHNDQWYQILDLAADAVPGTVDGFAALIHPDDQPLVWQRLERLLSGESDIYISEHRLLGKNGPLWVQDRGAIVERNENGQPVRVIGSYVDITKRRQNEAELVAAREAAEQANAAKSRFLATMSHEIRTPMNGILGMAQLLMMPNIGEQERREFAETILASGQTLLTLLNDILDFSKVEAGKLELSMAPLDPGHAIQDVAELFNELAQNKGLSIQTHWTSTGRQYAGDPIRIRQMLSNLVSNAIKFTPRGHVTIEAREISHETQAAVIEFSVTDSGIGIPADKQAMLFHPFTQADSSTSREYGGTGLGLSIVRSLAKLMAGDVGLESTAGQGSRFWFRIRCTCLATEAPTSVAPLAPDSSPQSSSTLEVRHVLVVEDNAINRRVVGSLLGKLDVVADMVDNGQQAVDYILSGKRPQLILMDCQMPVMDGYTATSLIRDWEAQHQQPRLPIIALTAGAFEEDREKCLAAGMDDFITKPVDFQKLGDVLKAWQAGPARAG